MGISKPAGPGERTLADLNVDHDFWFHGAGLRPDEIATDSHTHVWMICDEFHVYERKAMIQATGLPKCPVCLNRVFVPGVNDFATTNPSDAACFVQPGRTGATPETASVLSRAIATWRCDRGHEFTTSFGKMAREHRRECHCAEHKRLNRGFSDLATRNPVLAAQFDIDRNGCTPHDVDVGSKTQYWWICPAGHTFKATPANRRCIGPMSNGCRECYLASPIDPVTHNHCVDQQLRPTDAERAAYFRIKRPRYRPRPARREASPLKGCPSPRYTDAQKAEAVSTYVAELRRQPSHSAAVRVAAEKLRIGTTAVSIAVEAANVRA